MILSNTFFSAVVGAVLLAGFATAHSDLIPGTAEFMKREELVHSARSALGGCQAVLKKRGGVYDRARARRENSARKARAQRALEPRSVFKKRDFATVNSTSHASNLTDVSPVADDPAVLFDGNSSCVLGPEETQGPYYVNGEHYRWDVREDQEGVDMYVDIQLIDVNTCEPATGVFIDWWHANATGVYSGVVASGNGDSTELTNINNTFLRGIQKTNDEGVAQFLSIVPGHYTGRATHVHIIAQENGTWFSNGTYTSPTVQHITQFFFDQELITAVEALPPYSTNTQNITINAEDSIMVDEAGTIDPVLEYVLLGNDLSEGIFAWISVGINTTASYTTSAAATLTEEGGVANANSGMGGGGMSGSGVPSGVPPGTVAPSSIASTISTAVSSSVASTTAV